MYGVHLSRGSSTTEFSSGTTVSSYLFKRLNVGNWKPGSTLLATHLPPGVEATGMSPPESALSARASDAAEMFGECSSPLLEGEMVETIASVPELSCSAESFGTNGCSFSVDRVASLGGNCRGASCVFASPSTAWLKNYKRSVRRITAEWIPLTFAGP
jgi:hypothetical protein